MPTESAGEAFGAADASAMASSRVPEASAPRSALRRNWLLAISGLLLAGVVGIAVFSAGYSDNRPTLIPGAPGPVRQEPCGVRIAGFDRRFRL